MLSLPSSMPSFSDSLATKTSVEYTHDGSFGFLSISVIFVLIYFLVLVLVFQLFFRFSFVLVFIIFPF